MNQIISCLSLVVMLTACTTWAVDVPPVSPTNLAKPNIVWIMAEDTSPWMGCYGDQVNANATPNIDALADTGVRFARAFVPAPVCSACRSAMMLGQNQIRFGAHEHRSSRGPAKLQLPTGFKLLPEIMTANGYTSFNRGKDDYNFVYDNRRVYANAKLKQKKNFWQALKKNQPFFIQIQTRGGKNNTRRFPADRKTDASEVTVPPDYPQNEIYRETVAQHYDAIRVDDDLIGKLMTGLRNSEMADNTIVVYFSDHGANNLVRHKQMVTEGGLHVPFIITGPQQFVPKSGVRNDLVNMLDLTATTLAWAGIAQPDWYEGRNLFAPDFQPRDFVAAAKDRMDHTLDRVRTIRTDKFRYTRNYKTDRILLQPQYRDPKPFTKNLRELYATNQLAEHLRRIYFGERPAEELYDVSVDPHQLNNLAGDSSFLDTLNQHRQWLDQWLAKGDLGAGEESVEAMRYNADGKKWGTGVNPEYEVYRKDSDGDGLSDVWEDANGRDAADGRLYFEFDCGGWQTEGWTPEGIDDNIAGFLGFLDFHLKRSGSLIRKNLSTKAGANDRSLQLRLRVKKPLALSVSANGKLLTRSQVEASEAFSLVQIPLSPKTWTGKIESLEINFDSAALENFVEIDSVQVLRQ